MDSAISLHYKKYGKGKTIIVMHGLFGSLDNWNTLSGKMAEHGFCVYNTDLRNHGHSPHTQKHNYDCMSDDIIQLIQKEKLQSVHLIGHSMGAKVAMHVAGKVPDFIHKMILVDMAPRAYAVQHHAIISALQEVDFTVHIDRKKVEEVLSRTIKEIAVRQFLLKGLYWKNKNELAWRFNLQVLATEIEEMGKEYSPPSSIAVNTLFIAGTNSDYIHPEDELDIQSKFLQSSIVSIPNAGHWVHAEKPSEFLKFVIEFLKE